MWPFSGWKKRKQKLRNIEAIQKKTMNETMYKVERNLSSGAPSSGASSPIQSRR